MDINNLTKVVNLLPDNVMACVRICDHWVTSLTA